VILRLAVALLFLVALASRAVSGTFGFQPTQVTIDNKHRIVEISLSSLYALPAVFDVTVQRWTQEQGHDIFDPAPDVIIVPSVFTVNPYGTVPVRVTFRGATPSSERELSFKVQVREVVRDASTPVTTFSIPLFVPTHTLAGTVTYSLKPQATTQADLVVNNTGSSHIYIESLRISSAGHDLYDGAPKAFVLSGQTRILPLQLKAPLLGTDAELTIKDDRGSHSQRAEIVP